VSSIYFGNHSCESSGSILRIPEEYRVKTKKRRWTKSLRDSQRAGLTQPHRSSDLAFSV